MLFLSCQIGLAGAVKNAGRFAAEAEAQVIKIEAGGAYLDVIKAVSDGLALAARRSATSRWRSWKRRCQSLRFLDDSIRVDSTGSLRVDDTLSRFLGPG